MSHQKMAQFSRILNFSKLFHYTDKNIFDDSYYIVTHFPDFPLWEKRIAYFK